jgi:hypothetical protein
LEVSNKPSTNLFANRQDSWKFPRIRIGGLIPQSSSFCRFTQSKLVENGADGNPGNSLEIPEDED